MTTTYLMPCQCGNKIPVELAQAGQTIRCSCGQSLAVPTMSKIKNFETAERHDERPRSASDWGARQRVFLMGLVVILATVPVLAYFSLGKPVPPAKILETDVIERHTEGLTLVQSYQLWDTLRQGLSKKRPIDERYDELLAAYHRRMGITLVFLSLGVVTVAVGFFIPKPRAAAPGQSA